MQPPRILFLDSWLPSAHEGSGTAVGISSLHRGLQGLGVAAELLRPAAGAGTLLGRARFNLALPRRLRARPPGEVVVGFDLDGFRWSQRRPAGSRYLVSLKGIAADEARFSVSRRERLLLDSFARLERTNVSGADLVLVTSRYSAEVAKRAYGLRDARLRIVPEPIDMATWDALRNNRPALAARPTILSVARQYPRKDTATLLRALVLVRREVPDVHLRIIGGGPELSRLHALAEELALWESVTFQGAIPEDVQVRRAYFEAHLFALPSRQEGFGIVFLEAMAAGLPIVAARAGAVPEVVHEGGCGILVPERSPEPLAEAILRLLGDPAVRERMGAAGVRRARDFDLPVVARRFLEAIAQESV